MNNIDIDTILISSVVLLLIVVIARIAIQRYRMAHIKLPDNLREAGGNSQEASAVRNRLSSILNAVEGIEEEPEADKKDEEPIRSEGTEKTKEIPAVSEDKLVKESESKAEDEIEKNELKYKLDYQQLINDPASIIKNDSIPSQHRIVAIREVVYQKLESAVPVLIEALYDPDPSISLVAAESLGAIGDPRAIEPLMEISQKNDIEISKAVEEYVGGALVVVEGQPVSAETEDVKDVSPKNYKEMVVFTPDQLPREYFQSDGSLLPRKELVIKGLQDDNEQLRQMAAKAAIGLEEADDVIEPLSKALENPLESEAIRAMAAEALGGMDSEKSISLLIKALKDENVAVRYASTSALAGHKEAKVVEALIGATRDSDKYVRASAAYALGTTGAAVALKALIKCAEDDNEVVRFSAVKAISTYTFDDVFKRLNKDSKSESRSGILAKIEILSQFKEDKAVEILKQYLEHVDSEISYRASMALMGQENPDLIEELIDASRRLDEELYRLAKEKMAPEVFDEVTKFNTGFGFNKSSFGSRASNEEEVLVNGEVPPSRDETIRNVAEAVRAKNSKKEERVLHIDTSDYSGSISFELNEDNHGEEHKKDGSHGFNNERLDVVSKKEETVINLDDYKNELAIDENNEIEQTGYNEIVEEEELVLEDISGLSPEFEKIRKKLVESSPNARGGGANLLGNYGDHPEALLLLRAAIKDENEHVRVSVIKSLSRIGNMEALKLILSGERDVSTEVRYAVVKALGEIPDYSAIEALKRMAARDVSIDVKRNARIALEKQS